MCNSIDHLPYVLWNYNDMYDKGNNGLFQTPIVK